MFKQFTKTANTPLKRIGLIFTALAVFVFASTAIHWNIEEKGFIYKKRYSRIEPIPKPEAEKAGTIWKKAFHGWELYDKACVAADKETKSPFVYTPPEKCRLKYVPHKRQISYKWQQSFGQYFNESIDQRWGDYFWFNVPAFLFLILGLFLYLGVADRLVAWIRTGNVER